MELTREHLIWVNCSGYCSVGFTPCQIAEFEELYDKLYPTLGEDPDPWLLFNEYFSDDLGGREAYSYYTTIISPEAWDELEDLYRGKRTLRPFWC